MKLSWVIIPLIAIGAILMGSRFTSGGMDWYRTITLPSWTPPGSVIGAVWTVIYTLTSLAACIHWNSGTDRAAHGWITALFVTNVILNVLWSFLFFTVHEIGWAVVEMILLNVTTIGLMILLWPISRLASLLLLPYVLWVSFATYLACTIWRLN